MGNDVGGNVQARAMLPLDDGPLLADGLNGIEQADPDTATNHGEHTGFGGFKQPEGFIAHYPG